MPNPDEASEEVAELVANLSSALMSRLESKGFSRSEALEIIKSYITSTDAFRVGEGEEE